MALISVLCPICEKDASASLFAVEGLQLVRCKECGLTYFNPNVRTDEHYAFLGEDFFIAPIIQQLRDSGRYDFSVYMEHVHHPSVIGYPDYLEPEHLRAKELWGRTILSWFVKAWQEQKFTGLPFSILEMGCATGHMLLPFKEAEWKPIVGQEVSEWIVQHKAPMINIRLGELHTLDFGKDKFDCVLCWDSFEHTHYPNEALCKIYEATNDQMLMIWQTPNVDLASQEWYLWSPRQHNFFLNHITASKLLEKHGFKIIGEKISPEADEMVLLVCKDPISLKKKVVHK